MVVAIDMEPAGKTEDVSEVKSTPAEVPRADAGAVMVCGLCGYGVLVQEVDMLMVMLALIGGFFFFPLCYLIFCVRRYYRCNVCGAIY
ncbi:unnamed protein product [Caenorhabditis auriculariae]|uniref:Brain protein I3 n=1 Tax=Caenorhabditis auriculariae TaxID=2777116 RepID=A0A8S1HGI8_9PELO|nr:unnamed protein product [Caenorhabditis auriculariae]